MEKKAAKNQTILSEIKIDKGIPIPKKLNNKTDKFPFAKMAEIGDSFFDNTIKGNSAYVYAMKWAKKNNLKWKFTWKVEKDGFRIWRIG